MTYSVEFQLASGEWRTLPGAHANTTMAVKAAKSSCAYWRVLDTTGHVYESRTR